MVGLVRGDVEIRRVVLIGHRDLGGIFAISHMPCRRGFIAGGYSRLNRQLKRLPSTAIRPTVTRLIPPPTGDDPYEDEAYRLWGDQQQVK